MKNTYHYINGPEMCIDSFDEVKELFVYDGAIDNNLRIRMVEDGNILNKETHKWLADLKIIRPRLLIFLKDSTNSKIHLDVDTPVETWAEIVRPLRLRKLDYRDYLRTCALNWIYDITGAPTITGVTKWYETISPPDMITTTDAKTGSMAWLNESQFDGKAISECRHSRPLSLFNTSIPHCIKGARNRLCISLRFDLGDDDNPSYEKMLNHFGSDVIMEHPEYNLTGNEE